MQFFAHDEYTASWFRPRHPIVCGLDNLGMAITLFLLFQTKYMVVQSYLLSVLFLYFFSALFHWLPYVTWRGKVDHIMIFVLIAMTAMPYWGSLIPFAWEPLGSVIITLTILIGIGVKLCSYLPRKLSAVIYAGAGLPVVCDIALSWEQISSPWNVLWMVGIGFYVTQLIIYTYRLCDFKKDLFGHREMQHIFLLMATTLHSVIAIALVG